MSASQLAKRRVDPLNNSEDFECLMLAEFGLSGKFISQSTHLSPGQVGYRIRKAGMSLRNYRNGVSNGAQWILRNAQADTDVSTKLREALS